MAAITGSTRKFLAIDSWPFVSRFRHFKIKKLIYWEIARSSSPITWHSTSVLLVCKRQTLQLTSSSFEAALSFSGLSQKRYLMCVVAKLIPNGACAEIKTVLPKKPNILRSGRRGIHSQLRAARRTTWRSLSKLVSSWIWISPETEKLSRLSSLCPKDKRFESFEDMDGMVREWEMELWYPSH